MATHLQHLLIKSKNGSPCLVYAVISLYPIPTWRSFLSLVHLGYIKLSIDIFSLGVEVGSMANPQTKCASDPAVPRIKVSGVPYRKLTSVLRAVCEDETARVASHSSYGIAMTIKTRLNILRKSTTHGPCLRKMHSFAVCSVMLRTNRKSSMLFFYLPSLSLCRNMSKYVRNNMSNLCAHHVMSAQCAESAEVNIHI